jgi:hypothetical protein
VLGGALGGVAGMIGGAANGYGYFFGFHVFLSLCVFVSIGLCR